MTPVRISVVYRFIIPLLLLYTVSTNLFSQEKQDIKILIVTGGHGFQEKEFYELFEKMPGIKYDKIVLPGEMDRLAPGLEKEYDVLVTYDMNHFPMKDGQLENFSKLIREGMPLLVFHHSFCAYPDWPEYRKIAGGDFLYKTTDIDGKQWKPSSTKVPVDMEVEIVDKNHPITKGMDSFTIHDEAYKDIYVCPDIHLLLKTAHPDASPQIAWCHQYGKANIFTILLGHDRFAYENPQLQKILLQGICWLASEKK